jgi:hypothetical protein
MRNRKAENCWFIASAMLLAGALGVQAEIIAEDDFSSGTVGAPIDNIAVQKGTGMWTAGDTAGRNKMHPLQFGAGGFAIPGLPVGGNAVLSTTSLDTGTQRIKLSVEFSARENKTNPGGVWLIGLFEILNKGFLVNEDAGDLVAIRFFTSGSNEGRFRWRIFNDGIRDNDADSPGASVSFDADDVIRLTLSYDPSTGEAVAEAFNVTTDSLLVRDTQSTRPGLTFNHAGIGMSGFEGVMTDPTRAGQFVLEVTNPASP